MNSDQPDLPEMETAPAPPDAPFRLRFVYVDNFKSLVEFHLNLDAFTCLIGLNGSGKSTVIQAIDFIAQLFKGDVSGWLAQRQWKPGDLNSKLVGKSNIHVVLEVSRGTTKFIWVGSFNRTSMKCTGETLEIGKKVALAVSNGHCWFGDASKERKLAEQTKIHFEYEGSILSQLKDEVLPDRLLSLKHFLQGIASLDLLAPHLLRKKTSQSLGALGMGGERLSAFLYELSTAQRQALGKQLKEAYPHVSDLVTRSLRAGWKELGVNEHFGGKKVYTEARHINDGMLRLMAILAEVLTDAQFLLFDEIENGINPELVEFLMDTLINAKQQILVTTHSPMILNYLDDEVARKGVQYLYRTPEGFTRAVPFFEIPSMAAKLKVMGPGEAFFDTQLALLADEIATMPKPDKDDDRADPR
ncbi:AAA family ATPase [Thiocapsa imhoffii]|nr:ATP-binding protein [Thiocapsa imhoffii]